jgi:flagellar hook-basal body complex protein FliE
MDLRIESIQHVSPHNSEKANKKGSEGFSEVIKGAISRVSRLDKEANESIVGFLQGKRDVTETMIALQKSEISMRLVLAIRNKVIEAYREIMHMNF